MRYWPLSLLGLVALAALGLTSPLAYARQTRQAHLAHQSPCASVCRTSEQSPPTSSDLISVDFVDAQHGWAVGTAGAVIATTDGGHTWTRQQSGVRGNLWAVDFVDRQHGWIAGASEWNGIVLRTSDGGTTWTTVLQGNPSGNPIPSLRDVQFLDEMHGWAVGDAGHVMATDDGGTTWRRLTLPSQASVKGVAFVDELHGWVSVYRYGDDAAVYGTQDGGATWTAQLSTLHFDAMNTLAFADQRHGWMLTGARLWRTDDGGFTWTASKPQAHPYASLFFLDARQGWILSGAGVFATSDGGRTWSSQLRSGTSSPGHGSFCFVGPQRGWAVGLHGTVMNTLDGGRHWEVQTSALPGTPVPRSPQGTVRGTRPTFTWAATPRALRYQVTVRWGAHKLRQAGIITTSWRPAEELPRGVPMTWEVLARNDAGRGESSPPVSFTIR